MMLCLICTLCQYQINCSAANDTSFEDHPLVGNGISRTDLNEQPLQERYHPEKQNQQPCVVGHGGYFFGCRCQKSPNQQQYCRLNKEEEV